MDRINWLPDELLVKILFSVPTKVAVSTSILSKRWESLWKLVPKLECKCNKPGLLDFAQNNLPLRAPIIESLCLEFRGESFQVDDLKQWVETAVSRCLRELSINYVSDKYKVYQPDRLVFTQDLYTSKSLVTLKLKGKVIVVDVPRDVSLPCLKTLQLRCVQYSDKDSLRQLLSHCPVLDDLYIKLDSQSDTMESIVVMVPTLQRLYLKIENGCDDDCYVIVTPSLKYFKIVDDREVWSYLIDYMPKLEEADIYVLRAIETLLESFTSVKRFTLRQCYISEGEHDYPAGIVFHQLEQVKLQRIGDDYWSKLVTWLLKSSPKLRVLNLDVDSEPRYQDYEPDYWKNIRKSVPECLKTSLETLEFIGYEGRPEERDFMSFIFKRARCLKTSFISHRPH